MEPFQLEWVLQNKAVQATLMQINILYVGSVDAPR